MPRMSRRAAIRAAVASTAALSLLMLVMAPRHVPVSVRYLERDDLPRGGERIWGVRGVGSPTVRRGSAIVSDTDASLEDDTEDYSEDIDEPLFVTANRADDLILDNDGKRFANLDDNMEWTHHDGGTNGYTVWSNLYLSGGVLVSVVPDDDAAEALPKPRAVMSAYKETPGGNPAAGADRWDTIVGEDLARVQMGNRVIRLPGVTYLFNDPPGPKGFLMYYDHFLSEAFVPAARAVASAAEKNGETVDERLLPQRIMFPRCGSSPSWRDDRGRNVWFLSRVLPGVSIEDANQWNDRALSEMSFIFDLVVIVDRWAAHSNQGEFGKWGKMNSHVPGRVSATSDFFRPFRDNMVHAIGDPLPNVGRHNLPVVVLVVRSHRPFMDAETKKGIIAGLKNLTHKAEVHVASIPTMGPKQRIALFSRASVVIAQHQPELYDAVWLPAAEGATLIELFEEGGFARDLGILCDMINIDHTVIQGNRVLTEDLWANHPKVRGPGEKEVKVDPDLVLRVVEAKLDDISKRYR